MELQSGFFNLFIIIIKLRRNITEINCAPFKINFKDSFAILNISHERFFYFNFKCL